MLYEVITDEVVRRAFDASMTLYAEHSFNASTFTARVVTSTPTTLPFSATSRVRNNLV